MRDQTVKAQLVKMSFDESFDLRLTIMGDDVAFMLAATSDLIYLCSVCVTVISTEIRGNS